MANPALNTTSQQQTFNASVPAEGPKIIPLYVQFTATLHAFDANLLLAQAGAQMRSVAGIFIDNFANNQQLLVSISQTGHAIRCPAFSQGFFTLFVSKNGIITFSDPSAQSVALVPVYLTNFPVANHVWTP